MVARVALFKMVPVLLWFVFLSLSLSVCLMYVSLSLSLALQPSAGYGLLVLEVFVITHNDAP
jgi:hypothetical protein